MYILHKDLEQGLGRSFVNDDVAVVDVDIQLQDNQESKKKKTKTTKKKKKKKNSDQDADDAKKKKKKRKKKSIKEAVIAETATQNNDEDKLVTATSVALATTITKTSKDMKVGVMFRQGPEADGVYIKEYWDSNSPFLGKLPVGNGYRVKSINDRNVTGKGTSEIVALIAAVPPGPLTIEMEPASTPSVTAVPTIPEELPVPVQPVRGVNQQDCKESFKFDWISCIVRAVVFFAVG
jgi:hypothetical protein